MTRVGPFLIAGALAGVIAACSFIDPLDDISGGKRDASAAPIDAGTPKGDDDDSTPPAGTKDAGKDPFVGFDAGFDPEDCNVQEREPNNGNGNGLATLVAVGLNCGVLTGGIADTDTFAAMFNSNGSYTIIVDSSVPIDVEVNDPDQTPIRRSFKSNEAIPFTANAKAGGFVQIVLTAPAGVTSNVSYEIIYSGP